MKKLLTVVGIATTASPADYDGKFVKYNHSLGKFEFDTITIGAAVTTGDIVGLASEGYVDAALVGFTTSEDLVGFITSGNLVGLASEGYVDAAVVGFITSGNLVGYATTEILDSVVSSAVSSIPVFDQDLNTTDNVIFNRIGITTGEINVGLENSLLINVEGMGQPYTYTFGSGGIANFPGNIEIGSGGYSFFEDSGVDSAIQANSVHNFKIHVGGYNNKVWAFSTDGSLTLPGGTVATSSSISTPIPNDEFQDGDPFAIRIYRGFDQEYGSFVFENDRLVFPDSNGRIISGGGEWNLDSLNNLLGFPSNDFISYDDINGSGFDLFTYEKPIRITAAQSNVWAFSTDGSLTTPGDIIVSSGSSIGIGSEQPTASLDVQGGDIKVGVNTSTGVILTDENGVAWRLHVNTDGSLSTTPA